MGPEIKPKQLLLGTATREPAGKIHVAFNNLDRLANQRRKIKNQTSMLSSISMLATFESNIGAKFFRSSCLDVENGHIVMQSDFMMNPVKQNLSPLESDSIHGFIVDDYFAEVNVTFTSGFFPDNWSNHPVSH
uniref:Uncharacterized protein n=1 Tax=Spongospora subterranea TaxID=70186 RepID=A0A0H5QYK2_9EUKA|eukprot:CRZ06779.1 hypothetical protein [Spongospora subterranea]